MNKKAWNDWLQDNPDRVAHDTAEGSAASVSSRMDEPSEQMIQKEVVAWCRANATDRPELAYIYSQPNEGRRDQSRGWRDMGMKAGVPDLILPVPSGDYGALYLELKANENDLTTGQWTTMMMLRDAGNAVDVAWSAEQAIFVLRNYLDDPDSFLSGY